MITMTTQRLAKIMSRQPLYLSESESRMFRSTDFASSFDLETDRYFTAIELLIETSLEIDEKKQNELLMRLL